MSETTGTYQTAEAVLDGATLAAMDDRQLRLAYAETLSTVRLAERELKLLRFSLESELVNTFEDEKALGRNEAARERATALWLKDQPSWQMALSTCDRLYRARVLYEAEIAARDDARRDREIAARLGGQP